MKIRIDLKIFIFFALFYLTRQIEIYAAIMVFCIIHELGHMIAGFILGMLIEKIEIMPYGISISFKQRENSKTDKYKVSIIFEIKKIIIALAGPLINLIIILLTYKYNINLIIEKETIIYSNLLILIFNLLPIYPLDGGRVLKGILYITCDREGKYINKISNIVAILFTVFSSICTYYYKNIAFFIITMFIWILVIRENKKQKLKNRIIQAVKCNSCNQTAIK